MQPDEAVKPIILQFGIGSPVEHHYPDVIVEWLSWGHNQYPFVGQLLIMMMLDILTGIAAGIVTRKLCSTISQAGAGRKIIMLLAVVTGVIIEPYTGGIPTGKLVAVFYTFTEGISILENLGRAGVPIPKVLADMLIKLKESAPESTTKLSVSIDSVNNATGDRTGSENQTVENKTVTTATVTTTEQLHPKS